ncbi:hypothetical protein Tco_0798451 [Tanacetum coccineum]
MFTQIGVDTTAAPRGGRTGGRTGRGGGRTGEPTGRVGRRTSKLGGQGGVRGSGTNGSVYRVPDFSTVIAQQLQDLLPTIIAQVGNHVNNPGNNGDQKGNDGDDNIQGNVRNVVTIHHFRICEWDEIVDKLVGRLSKWKMKTLSIGGRLTLLKAVLGSMSIYHMSIFKVPMKVLHRMESIRSRFFNGVDLNSKKSIWVKWKNVLASKEKGGLGVSSLYALNRALLFKWVWRFITQKELLWSRVIKAIHGEKGRIGCRYNARHKSVWCDIIREVDYVNSQGFDLFSFMQRKVGNGEDTCFWDDVWCGETSLSVLREVTRSIPRWRIFWCGWKE